MTKHEPMAAREAWIICDSNVAENEAEMLRARVIMRALVEAHEAFCSETKSAIRDRDLFPEYAQWKSAMGKLRALERGEDQT